MVSPFPVWCGVYNILLYYTINPSVMPKGNDNCLIYICKCYKVIQKYLLLVRISSFPQKDEGIKNRKEDKVYESEVNIK